MIVFVSEEKHTQTDGYKKNPILSLLCGIDYKDGMNLQMAESWTDGW